MDVIWWVLLKAVATCGFFLNEEPHMTVDDFPKKLVHTFLGRDNLRVLLVEGDHAFVGGRDVLYNVSLSTMQAVGNISWSPSDVANCRVADCGNFIRVVMRLSADGLLLCGTHALAPRCRIYKRTPQAGYVWRTEVDGKVVCPADGNQSAVLLLSGKRLVTGVSSHVQSGRLPLLYANPIRSDPRDRRQLNTDAIFVGVVSSKDCIYFFLRETAHQDCDQSVESAVVRVRGNDPGTTSKAWTSLAKARLRCAITPAFPHIRDVSSSEPFDKDRRATSTVYAVFGSTGSPIQSSAVCVFDVDSIDAAMRGVQDERLVEVSSREPLLLHAGFDYSYTSVAVDYQVEATSGTKFDVVYVGTSHGHVIKVVDVGRDKAAVVEDVWVFPEGEAVRQLRVVRGVDTLLVSTYSEVVSVPLDNCNWTATTCADCVGLQDPYCAWDDTTCESVLRRAHRSGVIQNVTWGQSSSCEVQTSRTSQKRVSSFYSARTLGLAVSFCVLPSVLIGIITGYWFGAQRKKSSLYLNYK